MKIKTDYTAHIAGGLLAVMMGAGSVALAGGILVDGRTDGLDWRVERTRAAPEGAIPHGLAANPAPKPGIRV